MSAINLGTVTVKFNEHFEKDLKLFVETHMETILSDFINYLFDTKGITFSYNRDEYISRDYEQEKQVIEDYIKKRIES